MKRSLLIFSVLFSASSTGLLLAQRYRGPQLPPPPDLSSLSQSLSDVIRSSSQSSNRLSMAAIDKQQARSMELDNQIKQTKTYFEKRKLNKMYREAEAGPRWTQQQYSQMASEKAPDRLSSSQWDSLRGTVHWPQALRGDSYVRQRGRMNELLAQHAAAGGGMNTPYYSEIQRGANYMQEQLKKDISRTTPEQYTYARKFLVSLAYEARFPAGS